MQLLKTKRLSNLGELCLVVVSTIQLLYPRLKAWRGGGVIECKSEDQEICSENESPRKDSDSSLIIPE